MAENSEVRSLIESILKSSGPTGKGDIVSAFSAMQNSMIIQIDLSRRILKTLEESLAFNKEAESDRRRDDLLRDRVKPDTPRGTPEPKPNGSSGSSGSGSITDLLTSSFRNVFAALTAFQLASAGLRGWETRAISVIQDTFQTISDNARNGLTNIRNTLSNLPSVAGQISQRVENLRVRALRLFDLGPDGLPLNIRGADGRFTGYSVVGRVSARILELLKPLRNVASGISSFISGAGSDIYGSSVFTTLRGFASGVTGLIGQLFAPISNAASGISSFIAGAGSAIFESSLFSSIASFTRTVGRILRPLGFLISAYDGVTAYLDTDGTRYERFVAGISAFIGDFVGAPLDLLRDIVAWGMEQLGFDEEAEWLTSFSFESLITSMVSGIFSFVSRAVTYVRDLFTFSEEEDGGMLSTLGSIGGILYSGFLSAVSFITDLFSFGGEDRTLLGTLGNLTDIVFAPVNLAINFVRGIFGFNEDEQEEPFRMSTFIGETIGNAVDWVRDRVSGIGIALRERFMEFSEYVQSIPERIRFAAESMWIDLSERITIGFMEFGEWLGSIPSRLLVMALDVIRNVPGGSFLVGDSTYNEAVAAMRDNSGISASIAAVRASAETRRIELAARESAAERLREARLQYMAQSAAQAQGGGGMGGSVVSNSGNVTTDARTNATYNYYTSQDPSRAIDPSLAAGAS